jgi:hypothetical protein
MLKIDTTFIDSLSSISDAKELMLYISLKNKVIFHKCPCGCGKEIYMPLGEDEWELIYNGKTTLYPSIGNYNLDCETHYYIVEDSVVPVDTHTKILFKKRNKRDKKILKKGITL